MIYGKPAFSSRKSCSSTLVLLAGILISVLISNDGNAAPIPDYPRISPPSPKTPPIAKTKDNRDPIITAILEQLGVKKATPPPTSKTATTEQLADNEKQKSGNAAKTSKLKTKKKKSAKAKTPRKNRAQALAAFYSRADQQPLWVSKRGILKTTRAVLKEFRQAGAYGLRTKDFKLPHLPSNGHGMSAVELADFELKVSKTAIKYAAYARGGRINPRALSRFQDRGPTIPAPEKVLNSLDNSDKQVATLRSYHPQHSEFKALRKQLLKLNANPKKSKSSKKKRASIQKQRARILINMERWRWMPKKLQGLNNIFVWANIPELQVRIIRDGKTVFVERAIAGKRSKQSPMFSDKMEWIEFNPTWYIPNSIKVADILPSLRKKGRVMRRYHLKINCGKHGTDFRKIDWSKVDIRKCSVIQPTGKKSVLGKLKFKFPNKHAVYMHDTLTPGLFNRKHRILSHGCIRVRDPRRMAEILLANDKGMSSKRIGTFLARGGLHTERLSRSVPVHITYFSTRVKKDGTLSHHPDYYGHDKRLAQALLGKGHLFKGAIYSGSSRSRRKRKPRKVKPKPTFAQTIFTQQFSYGN